MQRLKELRTQRGLTQSQIGELLGVSCVTIARYEAGEREPSNAKLTTLANFFDVSVDYLMGREEPAKDGVEAYPPHLQETYRVLSQLTPQELAEVVEVAKFKLYQRDQNK